MAAAWGTTALVAILAHGWPVRTLALVALSAALAALGLWDDIRQLSPSLKFLTQTALSTGCVVFGHLQLASLSLPGATRIYLGAIGYPLSVVLLVAAVNVFNFMDGIDGLAAGQAFVQAAVLSGAAMLTGDVIAATLSACLAASSLGFLPYNWSPARAFMGDAGSYFCGGTIAALMIFSEQRGTPLLLTALPSVPFVVDVGATLAVRIARGDRLWIAHRGHLYQRLVARGQSHGHVASLYLVVSALLGALGLSLQRIASIVH
jgi:UDP-N-acetylmuramyl pentapeptide phosphotransferase/UDP-N-acetylglucosamine-1-phosphate transferase